MRRRVGTRGRVALSVAAALLVLAAVAQVVLPRIAASRISSRVARYGSVASVSVSAWPAVQLLWGHAGSVTVRARRLALSPAQAAALLWEARGVSSLDVSAEAVAVGTLRLQQASLRKRGSALRASARTTAAEAQAALPSGITVKLLGSGEGRVEVLATGSLFGIGASVRALAQASEGKLVVHPVGPLVEALALTLFSSERVRVQGVGASVVGSDPLTYELTMSAALQ
jgi:hypothetical protein